MPLNLMARRKIKYSILGLILGLMPGFTALLYDTMLGQFGFNHIFLLNPAWMFVIVVIPTGVFMLVGVYAAEQKPQRRLVFAALATLWGIVWLIPLGYFLLPHAWQFVFPPRPPELRL